MRANSRVHLLSEGALIGLLQGSKPLERVAFAKFSRANWPGDPLSNAVLCSRGHLQLRRG